MDTLLSPRNLKAAEVDMNPTNGTPQSITSSENVTSVWFWTIAGVINLLIFSANGLLAYVIIKAQRLHHSANWFILSLAVSNFLSGLFVIPSCMICNLWLSCNDDVRFILLDLVVYVSIANVSVMSLDRLAAVELPMRYQSMVAPRFKLWILFAWLVPVVVSIVPLCWMFAEAGSTIVKINKIFRAVQLVVFELLPCAIMVIVHGRIFIIRRKHSRQIQHQRTQLNLETQFSSESVGRSNFRTEKSVGVIAFLVFFFVLCWIFSLVLTSCKYFEVCKVSREALIASSLLVFVNPAVNPLICLFLKTDIRKEVRRLLRF